MKLLAGLILVVLIPALSLAVRLAAVAVPVAAYVLQGWRGVAAVAACGFLALLWRKRQIDRRSPSGGWSESWWRVGQAWWWPRPLTWVAVRLAVHGPLEFNRRKNRYDPRAGT